MLPESAQSTQNQNQSEWLGSDYGADNLDYETSRFQLILHHPYLTHKTLGYSFSPCVKEIYGTLMNFMDPLEGNTIRFKSLLILQF